MKHRIILNNHNGTVGTLLGTGRISRGGSIYFSKATERSLEEHTLEVGENVFDGNIMVYQGPYNTVRLASPEVYAEYVDAFQKALGDMTIPENRMLLRQLTSQTFALEAGTGRVRLIKPLMDYMGLHYEDGRRQNLLFGYLEKTSEEEPENRLKTYFFVNRARYMDCRLILMYDGIDSGSGRRLLKDSFKLLEIKSDVVKRILVIYNDDFSEKENYRRKLKNGCRYLGFTEDSIVFSDEIDDEQLRDTIETVGAIYIPDGRIDSILKYIMKRNLYEPIKETVIGDNKAVYIGSGAGAMIASKDLSLYMSNDNTTIVTEGCLETLGLFDGAIIPHCDGEELKKRLTASDKNLLNQYKSIISMGEDETLICLWEKKRLN